jgi:hypothetical protein
MIWDNDPYRDIKFRIFDDCIETLSEDLDLKISLADLRKVIDTMFETLTKPKSSTF